MKCLQAKAKIHKANSADELADTEDDSGHDGEQEDPAIVIVDDDEEEEESADDQDHKPAGLHLCALLVTCAPLISVYLLEQLPTRTDPDWYSGQ